jgi:hypothetical protein
MPLWLSLPAMVLLGVSSWISALDPTGGGGDSYLLWVGTAIALAFVVLRMLRIA